MADGWPPVSEPASGERPRDTPSPRSPPGVGVNESERTLQPGPAGQQHWELARPIWWTHGPIAVVTLLGAIFSGVASLKVSDWEQAKVENAFLGASRDRALVIQREIEHTLSVVQDIGNLFAASPLVKRREFRQFVGPALKRYEAIKALQWVPLVRDAERSEFIDRARRSFPPFQISEYGDGGAPIPARSRDVYYPVLYVQPYKLNREALGFDMSSDPALQELLEATATHGQLRLVSKVDLVSRNAPRSTLTAYLPVYRNTEIPGEAGPGDEDSTETVEQTPRELQGFVVGKSTLFFCCTAKSAHLSISDYSHVFRQIPFLLRHPQWPLILKMRHELCQ